MPGHKVAERRVGEPLTAMPRHHRIAPTVGTRRPCIRSVGLDAGQRDELFLAGAMHGGVMDDRRPRIVTTIILPNEDRNAKGLLILREYSRAYGRLMLFRTEIDDPCLACGAAQILAHSPESLTIQESARRYERHDSCSLIRMSVKRLPRCEPPKVHIEVRQNILMSATSWGSKGVKAWAFASYVARAAFASTFYPGRCAFSLVAVWRISDHYHDRYVPLDPFRLVALI